MEQRRHFSLAHRMVSAALAGGLLTVLGWIIQPYVGALAVLVWLIAALMVLGAIFPALGAAVARHLGRVIGLALRPTDDLRILYIQRRRREGVGMRQAKREFDEGRSVPPLAAP